MKNIIVGTAILLTSFLSYGQLDRSKMPEPGKAPTINIGQPEVFDLENGMKVILSTNHKTPTVSFNLVMGSDERLEGEKTGLATLMGDLILSGTENRTKDELDEEKDFIGASLFASSSSIYLSMLTKHMDKGLDILTDVMQNATFPESEFERIKKQTESGLYANRTEANAMMKNVQSKILFGNDHPYGEVFTEETLENITREDVVDLYQKQYTPEGSYLVIVGDINKEQAKTIAEERFGSWTGNAPFKKEYNHGITPEGKRVIFVEKPGAVQSVISVNFPIDIAPGDEDHIKLSVLNNIFGGHGFAARLFQNLREDKGYTYGAYSILDVDRKGSYLSATASVRNEVTDSSITEFVKEIENIIKESVTDEELATAKAGMVGSFARGTESPRTIASYALDIYRNNLPKDYYQNYLKNVDKVTKEDVLEMAQKYFSNDNMNIIVVGNEDVLESIKAFSSTGEVEILDEYGEPKEAVEYEKSDLTKQEVLEKYLMAVTQTDNYEAAEKKILALQTMTSTATMKPDGSPMSLNMTANFKFPNKNTTKMEINGMVIQEEIFDGSEGITKGMNQMGGIETSEMTEEEVQDKRRTSAAYEEFSLLCNLDYVELLGMEERNGKTLYVIQYEIGDTKSTVRYNRETGLKVYSDILQVTEEGPQSFSANFSDYQDYNGYLFPKTTSQMVESASITSTIESIEINKKINDDVFKVKK